METRIREQETPTSYESCLVPISLVWSEVHGNERVVIMAKCSK